MLFIFTLDKDWLLDMSVLRLLTLSLSFFIELTKYSLGKWTVRWTEWTAELKKLWSPAWSPLGRQYLVFSGQLSVLVSVLFNVFINSVDDTTDCKFADYTKLYHLERMWLIPHMSVLPFRGSWTVWRYGQTWNLIKCKGNCEVLPLGEEKSHVLWANYSSPCTYTEGWLPGHWLFRKGSDGPQGERRTVKCLSEKKAHSLLLQEKHH